LSKIVILGFCLLEGKNYPEMNMPTLSFREVEGKFKLLMKTCMALFA
jgi:hypothetical protein